MAGQAQESGRKVSQTASLTLSTDPDKVRGIAASVSDVVSRYHGLVISSQITSGNYTDGGSGSIATIQQMPVMRPLFLRSLPNCCS